MTVTTADGASTTSSADQFSYLAVNGVWTAAGGGAYSWDSSGNWQGGVVPNAVGDTALLGAVAGGGTATITLDAAETLSSLGFSPGAGRLRPQRRRGRLAAIGQRRQFRVRFHRQRRRFDQRPCLLGRQREPHGGQRNEPGDFRRDQRQRRADAFRERELDPGRQRQLHGGTTISGGTLAITTPAALASSGLVTIGSGGRLVLGSGCGHWSLARRSSPVTSSDATTPSDTATASDAVVAVTATASNAAATPSDAAPPITVAAINVATSSGAAAPERWQLPAIAAPVAAATTSVAATPGTVVLQQAIVSHDAVFRAPQAGKVVVAPSAAASWLSVPSVATEAVHLAALAGVSVPSATMAKSTAGKSLSRLSPKAILASTFRWKRNAQPFLRLTPSPLRLQPPALQRSSRRRRVRPLVRLSPFTRGGSRQRSGLGHVQAFGSAQVRKWPFPPRNRRVSGWGVRPFPSQPLSPSSPPVSPSG